MRTPTPRACPVCKGCGEIPVPVERISAGKPCMRACPHCGGRGTLTTTED